MTAAEVRVERVDVDEPGGIGQLLGAVTSLGVVVLEPLAELGQLTHERGAERRRLLTHARRDHLAVAQRLTTHSTTRVIVRGCSHHTHTVSNFIINILTANQA